MNVERKEKGYFSLLSSLWPSKTFNNFSYFHKSCWNVPVCSLLSLFFLYFFFQLMLVFKSRRKKEQSSFVPLYPAFQLCSLLLVISAMTIPKTTFIYLSCCIFLIPSYSLLPPFSSNIFIFTSHICSQNQGSQVKV